MTYSRHSQEYTDYIKSEKWRAFVEGLKKKRGYKCERCGSKYQLSGHHKTYDRLGHESDRDIEILCQACHSEADKERADYSGRRSYQSRLNEWAKKKYGDDWQFVYKYESVAMIFNQWLEDNGNEKWIRM